MLPRTNCIKKSWCLYHLGFFLVCHLYDYPQNINKNTCFHAPATGKQKASSPINVVIIFFKNAFSANKDIIFFLKEPKANKL